MPFGSGGGGASGIGGVIFDSTAGGNVNSFDTGASQIGSGFKLLMIALDLRTDEAVNESTIDMSFNGDNAGTSYDRSFVQNLNATVTGGNTVTQSVFQSACAGANLTAGIFVSLMLWVPNYASTTAMKTVSMTGGYNGRTAGSSNALYEYWQWASTSAINQFTVKPDTGGAHFIAGSRCTIYGF